MLKHCGRQRNQGSLEDIPSLKISIDQMLPDNTSLNHMWTSMEKPVRYFPNQWLASTFFCSGDNLSPVPNVLFHGLPLDQRFNSELVQLKTCSLSKRSQIGFFFLLIISGGRVWCQNACKYQEWGLMHAFSLIPYWEYKKKQKEFNCVDLIAFTCMRQLYLMDYGFLAIHLSFYIYL